ALPPPVATVTPAPRPHPSAQPAEQTVMADQAAKPAAAPEEPVQNLRDLPEPIQRSIPHIAVGGYIYSKNPADRLLLIDKVLRHEGEEVAAGLILEKLQPREAVFNFKGYRYRVPY
ncbi:GspB domain-containing protein, partial [Rugamonas sp. FT107W]